MKAKSDEKLTPEKYIESLTDERRIIFTSLRKQIRKNLPKGFSEGIHYGMLSYFVPHSRYPDGYHVNTDQPLILMMLGAQKNHVALYHMGLYADKKLLEWFKDSYKKVSLKKIDMGKSCVRFKNNEDVPIELISELVAKISVDDWIKAYEKHLPKNKKT